MTRLILPLLLVACASEHGLDKDFDALDDGSHALPPTGPDGGSATGGGAGTGGAGTGGSGTGGSGTGGSATGGTGTGTGSWGTGTLGRDPDDPPPEFGDDDCANGIPVPWIGPEAAVLATDPFATGQIDVPAAGLYDVYDLVPAESGASQTNESAWLRIPSSAEPDGHPTWGNCGDEYVFVDPDNNGPLPAGTTQYLGTFWLDAGVVAVEVHHYCPLYLAGQCPQYHDPYGTPCEGGTANSVHVTGGAVCLVPVL